MINILDRAIELQSETIKNRRYLHQNAEVGFDLIKTTKYIKNTLNRYNITPKDCGKSGIYAVIGNNKSGKTILLRADTDALPISEQSGEEFSSSENMHACGHDIHTAMLLSAAKILKENECELKNNVKILFQPAEELLLGAQEMIDSGILENPTVNAAFMLHTLNNVPLKSGTIIVSKAGATTPSADFFQIKVIGKGAHGAMPNMSKDSIIAASHIVTALDTIRTREISMYDDFVLTIGQISGGNSNNVIQEEVIIKGSFRSTSEKVQKITKESVDRISKNVAKALNCNCEVDFSGGCPCLINHEKLCLNVPDILRNILPNDYVIRQDEFMSDFDNSKKPTGSEDFAFYSQQVPSLMLAIVSNLSDYEHYPLHHPKVRFDEEMMPYGVATLVSLGMYI